MRILVDARLLQGGGIGRYLREVTGRWLADERVAEIRFLGRPDELQSWLLGRPGEQKARVVSWMDPVYSLRAQLCWAARGAEWSGGCDVAFFPHWDVPVRGSGPPRLLTVHDLTHFLVPGGFPLWKRVAGWVLLKRALRTAAIVVTISHASRRDLEQRFRTGGFPIRVISNGVSHDIFRPLKPDERRRAESRWGHARPFLLFVGPLKEHKGAATALEVLRRLRSERPELRLVQAGPTDIRDPAVEHLLRDPGLAGSFVQAGILTDDQLNEAYGISECLLHPARKEGFGLPPLEAMASGTPVLASNRASLPEVVGGGGILLDPDDPEAWTTAIRRLNEDPEYRTRLVGRGIERAQEFSWEKTARETLEAVQEAAWGGSRSSTTGS